jgi:glycosyltransferase involved in cell wall biosynthesis
LYVSHQLLSPPIEGHHVASKRIVKAAILAGIKANVATVEKDGDTTKAPENWVIIKSESKPQRQIPFAQPVLSVADEFLSCLSIAGHAKSSNSDLIHVLNVNKEAYLAAHVLTRCRKPLLLHFYHSPYVLTDDVFLLRNLAFRLGLYGRMLDNYALTVNTSLMKFLVEKVGADPERVKWVPCPIDTNWFKPMNAKEELRSKHCLLSERPIVAYVGSLHPARGLSVLISSLTKVLAQFPETLLLASHPRHQSEKINEQYLRAQIQSLGLKENVMMVGPSENIEEIYNLADVVVLPFQRPYWVDPPLVLLEAMSSGAVVVTTSVGAISDVVRNRENAVVVKTGSREDLADAIDGILESPNESMKMARKARETILRDYSYEAVGKKLLDLYELSLRKD